MITPVEISVYYDDVKPYIKLLQKYVKEALLPFCTKYHFAFLDRIKLEGSFTEKLETGRYESLDKVDDLYACTIIVPTRAREDIAINYCTSKFDNDRKISKLRGSTAKQPDTFRFDNPRLYCSLKRDLPKEMMNVLDKLIFEIQIKTALEHAWCEATRDYIYKSNEIDWKKKRLAAEIKASLEHFDNVFLKFDDFSETIIEHEWKEFTIKKQIIVYIRKIIDDGKIKNEMIPKDLSRFAENIYRFFRCYVNNKKRLGIEIEEAFTKFDEYLDSLIAEKRDPPYSVTLFQLFIGSLLEMNHLSGSFGDYYLLITSSMTSVFPKSKKIKRTITLTPPT